MQNHKLMKPFEWALGQQILTLQPWKFIFDQLFYRATLLLVFFCSSCSEYLNITTKKSSQIYNWIHYNVLYCYLTWFLIYVSTVLHRFHSRHSTQSQQTGTLTRLKLLFQKLKKRFKKYYKICRTKTKNFQRKQRMARKLQEKFRKKITDKLERGSKIPTYLATTSQKEHQSRF